MMHGFGTVMQVLSAHRYAVMLLWGYRVEATYYGADGASFAQGDRVFAELADGSALWTITCSAT